MGDIPFDARRVVDDLRTARKFAGTDAPSSWVPSDSFESTLQNTIQPPVHLNPHLHWMHENWDLRSLLAPPPARGVKGLVKRVTHRLVMVVLGPYFDRLQDYVGVNTRAVDTIARRLDDELSAQLRLLGAVRADMIDLAHHLDERLDG